jgi:hypothetical protein
MLLRVTAVLLTLAGLGAADSLTLRGGRVIDGQYLGGDARQIKMAVGDRMETYQIEDVTSLQFGGGQKVSADRDRDRDRDRGGFATQQAPPPVNGVQLPTGTTLTVRMIDAVDSERTRLGETFRCSLDEPVMIDNQTVIPRGADAIAKLVEDKQSGKFEGKTVLTLALQQVTVNGRLVDITTGDVSQASNSRGGRTAKVVGGTAAVGAIIGAIAGGGKGAAIGAASGAAVGGAAEVMTKGQQVKIPSETRLTFTLQQPVQL